MVGALLFGVLSYLEHMRTVRPSFLLSTYLLFTVAFDVVRSRSYSLNAELDTIASVFSSRAGVKLVLAVLEALPKRRLLLPEFQGCPPEAASGIYKRSLFWWLNGLFKMGYSRVLKVDDLFELEKHLQSDYLHRLLAKSWTLCKLSYPLPMLCLWELTTTSRSAQRITLALLRYFEATEVAYIGGCTTPTLPDCIQFLSAVFDQSCCQLLPGACNIAYY
jgi:hypothetical protein